MTRFKKILFSSKTNIVVFILAIGLLLFATIGGARAAISYYSSQAGVTMQDIGVTLMENNEMISWRDHDSRGGGDTWRAHDGELLKNMIGKSESVTIGKSYAEQLNVYNSGNINEYVRVSIVKFWGNKDGKKRFDLEPSYIDLHFVNSDLWMLDPTSLTENRVVLYYKLPLEVGTETPLFADTLTIDGAVANQPSLYEGAKFWLDIDVDTVQENNAQDAIAKSWGAHVIVEDDGSLSLM